MTLSTLTKRVWSNSKLSDHTKVNVYKAGVISTSHNSCTPREKVDCVSHALPQTYSGNHMAGQGDK